MTPEKMLFTTALGLQESWRVSDIRLDTDASLNNTRVEFKSGSQFACPACGAADQRVHDPIERSWQHLHLFQHQAYLHAPVPGMHCEHCNKTNAGGGALVTTAVRLHATVRSHGLDAVPADTGECRR